MVPGRSSLFIARAVVAALLLILIPVDRSVADNVDNLKVTKAWNNYKLWCGVMKLIEQELGRAQLEIRKYKAIMHSHGCYEPMSFFRDEKCVQIAHDFYRAEESARHLSWRLKEQAEKCDEARQSYSAVLYDRITELVLLDPQTHFGADSPPVKTTKKPPPKKRRSGPVKTTRKPQRNHSTNSSPAEAAIDNLLGLAIQAYGTSQGSKKRRSGGKPPSGGVKSSGGGRPCGGRCTRVINLPNGTQKRQYCIITTNQCGWYGYGRRRGPVGTPLVR